MKNKCAFCRFLILLILILFISALQLNAANNKDSDFKLSDKAKNFKDIKNISGNFNCGADGDTTLSYDDGTGSGYFSGFNIDDQLGVLFKIEDNIKPVALKSVELMLYDDGTITFPFTFYLKVLNADLLAIYTQEVTLNDSTELWPKWLEVELNQIQIINDSFGISLVLKTGDLPLLLYDSRIPPNCNSPHSILYESVEKKWYYIGFGDEANCKPEFEYSDFLMRVNISTKYGVKNLSWGTLKNEYR